MNKKYIIKYRVLLEGSDPLENKEMKINNCINGVHAQVRLEEYLKKKYVNFKQLIVSECKEDLLGNIMGSGDFGNDLNDLFSQFGDMFGGSK